MRANFIPEEWYDTKDEILSESDKDAIYDIYGIDIDTVDIFEAEVVLEDYVYSLKEEA